MNRLPSQVGDTPQAGGQDQMTNQYRCTAGLPPLIGQNPTSTIRGHGETSVRWPRFADISVAAIPDRGTG